MTGVMSPTPAWITSFFGGGNNLVWSDLESGRATDNWGPEVLAWIALLDRDENGVAVLPYLGADGDVVWYAVARSARAGRRLGEDIAGFVGASYGGFDGRPYLPDTADTPGQMLAEEFGAPMFRIAPEPRWTGSVRRSLGIYRTLLERRPSARRLAARSVGALRTRFDRALLVSNEEEATRLYEEILATGRLSLENRHYLKVRLLAGLGRWAAIAAEASWLRTLADLTLPPQVRAELLDALYRTHIDPVEDVRDVNAALEEFKGKLASFGRLFSTRQGLRQPRVVKAFLLHALLREQPQRAELEELLGLLPRTGVEAPFSDALRGFVDKRVPVAVPAGDAAADAAFDDFEYEHALRLYSGLPPTRKTVARMIQCAQMVGTADAASVALQSLSAISEMEATLPAPVRATIDGLRARVSPVAAAATTSIATAEPGTWLDWTRWIAAGAPGDEAIRVVEQQGSNWTVEQYGQRDAGNIFAQSLEDAAIVGPEIIQRALPHLYQAFVGDAEEAEAGWGSIYRALLSAVILAPVRSGDDLELARALAVLILETGLSEADYRTLARELTGMVRQDTAVNTFDWALDLAEVIATARAASPAEQMNLVVAVLEFARSRKHRLTRRQIEIVRALCADMEIPSEQYVNEPPEEDPDAQALTALAARSVAIYTLAETAGQRALQILTKLAPGVDVALNSDRVCTDKLAALARSAELFVFAWRSSKHAAYFCIKDHRPKEKRILMPAGKGTASIVRALLEA